MSYLSGLKNIFNLRTLIVAVIFGAIVYYYYSHRDWELNLPVVAEKRLDLVALLENAEPDHGFSGKKYYLGIQSDVHDNRDDYELCIRAHARSQFHYDGIPVHDDAVLKFGYGFFEVMQGVPLEPVTFEVEFEPDESDEPPEVLFSKTLTPLGQGRIRQYAYCELDLSTFEGCKGCLVFRCKSVHKYIIGSIFCAWVNPMIDSRGFKTSLGRVLFPRSFVAHDFIESPPDFLTGDCPLEKRIWARSPDDGVHETKAPCFLDYAFDPLTDHTCNQSGQRAAFSFCEDFSLDLPPVRLPDTEEVRLCFAIGLKELACAAGGADFTIRADGRIVFEESVEGGGVSDLWRDRQLDLSDLAGESVSLSFAVSFHEPKFSDVRIPESNPLSVDREGRVLQVSRSVAGFSHPVVEAIETETRRLPSKSKPNLIIVNIECLNSAYLGCYGSPFGLTPCMDRLAEEGILFKDFVAASSWTLPSVATLLTGVYPSIHGSTKEDRPIVPNRFKTLPELLQEHSVTTAAFVTNSLINRRFNFDQGFEDFVLLPCQNARKVNAVFRNWLESMSDFRFFAYIHYFEPHDPCNAPDGLRDRYVPEQSRGRSASEHEAAVRRLMKSMLGMSDSDCKKDTEYIKGRYKGEIAYMDRRLIDLIGILEEYAIRKNTVLIVTGDHGEEFMEHGFIGHGSHLYNESIRVPLIIWGPSEIIGNHAVVEGMADNASLYATAAGLMGITLDDELPGIVRPSLFPARPDSSGKMRFAFSETDKAMKDPVGGNIEFRSAYTVMNWRNKLISGAEGRECELYDLVNDPDEKHNLAGTGLPAEIILQKQMKNIRAGITAHKGRQYGSMLDARTIEVLKELGYN